ncbi:ABC transporter ATP-binding protein [Microbacterium hibisci]|uniref:ABC transporter ATP-binding protein n=1 Tax=Microbacterium hibisci TaxID=2036000 RepID=UPI00194382DC|nr:ABC transporter ATP-binding protein [Microbacterium hibisci]
MPDGQSLEFSDVTKRFGAVTAVSGLSARVEPGRVTGFLGPNGAGKTTTLRILLGLVRANEGTATIGGKRYAELDHPLQTVGAVLEASSFHPGRTAAAHLTIYAQAAGIPKDRVGEVLGLVGLTDAANRKVGGFSLGMRQRLGLAYALLGDPGVLVLDEPANGLDPEGIRWMRGFLRQLAAEGRTVLVSSHLLAEVQQTVDALLIISRGRLVFQGEVDELTDSDESATVVDAPDRAALTSALSAAGVRFEVLRSGLTVRGLDPAAVGAAAAAAGVALSSLHRRGPALEEVFLDLVNGTRVHASAAGAGALSPVGATDAAAPATGSPPPETSLPAAAGVTAGVAAAAGADAVAGNDAEVVAEEEVGVEATGADAAVGADAAPPEVSGEEDAGAQADVERRAEERAEAQESALSAAALDAETTGSPGAAASLAAAAGAAWAAEERADDEPREVRSEAEESGASASPTWAVASTGVIDVVSGPDASVGDPWAPEDADPDVDAIGTIDDELSTPEPGSTADGEPHADADARPDASVGDPWAPEDADPDVDAIGTIDDELSTPEPVDEDDDRPWEHYEKTESDRDADAFFAAFDHTADADATGLDAEAADAAEPAEAASEGDATIEGETATAATDQGESEADGAAGTNAEAEAEAQPEAWAPPETGPDPAGGDVDRRDAPDDTGHDTGGDLHADPAAPEADEQPADGASVPAPALPGDRAEDGHSDSRADEGGDR